MKKHFHFTISATKFTHSIMVGIGTTGMAILVFNQPHTSVITLTKFGFYARRDV